MEEENDFTSNEEIDSYTNRDNICDLTGYVDCIDGTKTVDSGKKIFCFVVNNGSGRRIRVLVWDKSVAFYAPKIQMYTIVSFKRLRCSPAKDEYFNKNENVLKQELSVINTTKVTIGKQFNGKSTEPKLIAIENILQEYGLISIKGYIKDVFEETAYKNNSYGTGVITDGHFKIMVQVYTFSAKLAVDLPIGTHVQVIGKVSRGKNFDVAYIQCSSLNDIKKLDGEPLSEDKLKSGFRTPKRKRFDENTSPVKKDV